MWEEEYATKDHIEFYYNDGTSCGSNIIDSIVKFEEGQGENGCVCHVQESRVLKIGEDITPPIQLEANNPIDIK
jgi:hypothetical protein